MAYDKVVDSAVLNAGLTQIANAIREKAGTSDSLAFPTAMAEAIAAIEAGGGSEYTIGSITTSEDTGSIELTHNLGHIPEFFFLFLNNASISLTSNFTNYLQGFIIFPDIYQVVFYGRRTTSSVIQAATNVSTRAPMNGGDGGCIVKESTENTIAIGCNNWGCHLWAGKEYIWVAR